MNYRRSTADFAGFSVDTFLDEADNSYVTLTSLAKGLDVSNQNAIDWVRRHNKTATGIPVTVGKFKKAATAYPVSVIREFIAYRRSLGDVRAIALTDAIVEAALDRHAKESNLVTVTSAQNELKMATVRLGLIEQWSLEYDSDPVVKAEFHKQATKEEKELVFAKVAVERYTTIVENNYNAYTQTARGKVLVRELLEGKIKQLETLTQGVSC